MVVFANRIEITDPLPRIPKMPYKKMSIPIRFAEIKAGLHVIETRVRWDRPTTHARRESPSVANTPLLMKVWEVTMLFEHVRET